MGAVGTTVRAEDDLEDLTALARGKVEVAPREGVARHGGLRGAALRLRGVRKAGRERHLQGWIHERAGDVESTRRCVLSPGRFDR